MQINAGFKASRPASSRHFYELLKHKSRTSSHRKQKHFPIKRRKHKKKTIQEKRRTEERKTTQKEKKTTHFHYIISLDNHAKKKKFASTKTFLQRKQFQNLFFPFIIFSIHNKKQNKSKSKTFQFSFPF